MWLPTKTRDDKSPCRLRGSSTCCVSSTHAVPSRGITTPRRTTSPASAAVWHQKRVRGHRRRQRIDEKSNCTVSTRQSTSKASITRRALTYARATHNQHWPGGHAKQQPPPPSASEAAECGRYGSNTTGNGQTSATLHRQQTQHEQTTQRPTRQRTQQGGGDTP